MKQTTKTGISTRADNKPNFNEAFKPIKPLKAIRLKCLDCCASSESEVKKCAIITCSLYPFRFGKNPYHKRASDKTKEKAGINNEEDME